MDKKPITFIKKHAFLLGFIVFLCLIPLLVPFFSPQPSQYTKLLNVLPEEKPLEVEKPSKKVFKETQEKLFKTKDDKLYQALTTKEETDKGYEQDFADLLTVKQLDVNELPSTATPGISRTSTKVALINQTNNYLKTAQELQENEELRNAVTKVYGEHKEYLNHFTNKLNKPQHIANTYNAISLKGHIKNFVERVIGGEIANTLSSYLDDVAQLEYLTQFLLAYVFIQYLDKDNSIIQQGMNIFKAVWDLWKVGLIGFLTSKWEASKRSVNSNSNTRIYYAANVKYQDSSGDVYYAENTVFTLIELGYSMLVPVLSLLLPSSTYNPDTHGKDLSTFIKAKSKRRIFIGITILVTYLVYCFFKKSIRKILKPRIKKIAHRYPRVNKYLLKPGQQLFTTIPAQYLFPLLTFVAAHALYFYQRKPNGSNFVKIPFFVQMDLRQFDNIEKNSALTIQKVIWYIATYWNLGMKWLHTFIGVITSICQNPVIQAMTIIYALFNTYGSLVPEVFILLSSKANQRKLYKKLREQVANGTFDNVASAQIKAIKLFSTPQQQNDDDVKTWLSKEATAPLFTNIANVMWHVIVGPTPDTVNYMAWLIEKEENGTIVINKKAKEWLNILALVVQLGEQAAIINNMNNSNDKKPYAVFTKPKNDNQRNNIKRPWLGIKRMYTPPKYINEKEEGARRIKEKQENNRLFNRVQLTRKINVIVGDSDTARNYLKVLGQNIFMARAKGVMYAEQATGVMPDKMYYIEGTSQKSWQRLYEAYNHASANKNQKIVIIAAMGVNDASNNAALYAYLKTVENLANVTCVCSISNTNFYKFIDKRDNFGLFFTEIGNKQGQPTGIIIPGEFNGNSLALIAQKAPTEIRDKIKETLQKDDANLGQTTYFGFSNKGNYHVLAFIMVIFLLLGLLLFFLNRRKYALSISKQDNIIDIMG